MTDRSEERVAKRGKATTRFLTEAVVIVVSILLAFSIEAGWQDRGERIREEQLKESLRTDVEATRAMALGRQAVSRDIAGRARSILTGIGEGVQGAALDSLVFGVGDVFIKGPWIPINHTYEQAVGAGDLALLEDSSLRFLLGSYSAALDNITEIQTDVTTQYYGQLEPFLVANTNYAEVAWGGAATGLVAVPFTTDSRTLAASREFANLLNLKLELEIEMTAALDGILRQAEAVLAALE